MLLGDDPHILFPALKIPQISLFQIELSWVSWQMVILSFGFQTCFKR